MLISTILPLVMHACGEDYDQDFFPQIAEDNLDTLIQNGAWIKECNGNLKKALMEFPTNGELDSVCDSLDSLGFYEETRGICSRERLGCGVNNKDKIQWDNWRLNDHFYLDLDWNIAEYYGTGPYLFIFKKSNVTLITMDLWDLISMFDSVLDFYAQKERHGFLKFKTRTYAFFRYLNNQTQIGTFKRLFDIENADRVEIIIEGPSWISWIRTSFSVSKMIESKSGSFALPNYNAADVFKIFDKLEKKENHPTWNCDWISDCKSEVISNSGQWNVSEELFANQSILFHIQLDSNQTFTIHFDNGVKEVITFNETSLLIENHNIQAQVEDSNFKMVLVILQGSIMVLYATNNDFINVHDFTVGEIIMEHIQSIQVEPNDDQTSKTILISGFFDVQRELLLNTLHWTICVIFGVVVMTFLIVITTIIFIVQRRSKSMTTINQRECQDFSRDDRESSTSGYELVQSCGNSKVQESSNHEENYY